MPETGRLQLVAGQQQDGFAHLIHKSISKHLDNLWAVCGWAENAAEQGLRCHLTRSTYAEKIDAMAVILPKVMKQKHLS